MADDFLGFWDAAGLVFAEDHPAVNDDVEDAAAAFNQFGLGAGFLLDLFRQTGGLWIVVSFAAIGDGDGHVLGSS